MTQVSAKKGEDEPHVIQVRPSSAVLGVGNTTRSF
jgi:hypothetical protein